ASAAGFEIDDGIVVDELGRVPGFADVFATGDAARFFEPALGTRRRVEHEDHANGHGQLVGANAAGAALAYDRLPFFYMNG
ncbi:MAG: NAD(P)/FAD-dependent oxidoreductase, partial [Candidatus Kryptoniota bacterium]